MMACIGMAACSSNQQQETVSENLPYTVIPFEKGVENEKQVKLSEIAEKITFVPLETTDTVLISKPKLMSIVYVDRKIVIPCSIGLLAFDENGKFLNTISQHPESLLYHPEFFSPLLLPWHAPSHNCAVHPHTESDTTEYASAHHHFPA